MPALSNGWYPASRFAEVLAIRLAPIKPGQRWRGERNNTASSTAFGHHTTAIWLGAPWVKKILSNANAKYRRPSAVVCANERTVDCKFVDLSGDINTVNHIGTEA